MARIHHKQFGQALIEANLITQAHLIEALDFQKKESNTLGYTLLKMGFLKEIDLKRFLTDKLGFEYANLQNYVSDTSITRYIPEHIAIKYQVVPLLKVKTTLTVAMVDPLDGFVLDVLKESTSCEIKPLISTWSEIKQAIEIAYQRVPAQMAEDGASEVSSISQIAQSIGADKKGDIIDVANVDSTDKSSIIKLINLVLSRAVEAKASDIHIEPDEGKMRIRFRVDGILVEVMSLPKDVEAAVSSRCKVMSELDIAEKRIPQDGRVKIDLGSRQLDLRVSTYPTLRGEKIVMRILDTKNVLWGLAELGFPKDTLEKYALTILKPNGIVLVTGPTGSGKSSTLYASLARINSTSINIVTLEDPVEYQMANINQGQVNVKAGFTFPSGLRSILRQDPDVIMVGEIRDLETAEISIRAALTGHLVFSTLHTNDAAGALTRLVDMGIEPFLVASSVIGIIAQRLVRVICSECKREIVPDSTMIKRARIVYKPGKTKMYQGAGCESCQHTGYSGRTVIIEYLLPNEKMKSMIISNQPTSLIKQVAIKAGMRTLRQDGLFRVLRGITTLEEVLRVSQEDEL